MENLTKQFGAVWTKALKKDGTNYYYLAVGVYDEKGNFTEFRKEFLNPLEKKTASLIGIKVEGLTNE